MGGLLQETASPPPQVPSVQVWFTRQDAPVSHEAPLFFGTVMHPPVVESQTDWSQEVAGGWEQVTGLPETQTRALQVAWPVQRSPSSQSASAQQAAQRPSPGQKRSPVGQVGVGETSVPGPHVPGGRQRLFVTRPRELW